MKRKNKFLVGLMALSLVGFVGTALAAMTKNSAVGKSTNPAFDSAIYLYWDANDDDSCATLSDITNLQVNVPQYSFLSVNPKSTKSVAGTVTLSFTLAPTSSTNYVDGLEVDVFETDSLLTNDNVATTLGESAADLALDKDHLSGTLTFSVTATGSGINTGTHAYYAIRVKYSPVAGNYGTKTLGGTVTIGQSFAAKA